MATAADVDAYWTRHTVIIIALLVAGVPWTLSVVIAVAVAMISFTVYERPLLRKGARLAREQGAARVGLVGQRDAA